MLQPVGVYNLRTRLLRRGQEKLGCMSSSEYMIIACIGFLTLGRVVNVCDSSDHVAFSGGLMMVATNIFIVVLTGGLALCAGSQKAQRTTSQDRKQEGGAEGPEAMQSL